MSILSFLQHTLDTSTENVFSATTKVTLAYGFPVTPKVLFHALTNSDDVALWMASPKAIVGNGLGKPVLIDFATGGCLVGIVCAYAPDETNFAYTCKDAILHFEVTATATGQSNLVFTQSDVPNDLAIGVAAGWHGYFDNLLAHLTKVPRTSVDADLLAHYQQNYTRFKLLGK